MSTSKTSYDRTKPNGVLDTEHYGYNRMSWMTWVRNGEAQNHAAVDWPNYTRTYTYTDRGELIGLAMPGGATETWTYDPTGLMVQYNNILATINYAYDADHNLLSIDYPAGTPDVTFEYDADNRRTEMVDGSGTTTWTYNSAAGGVGVVTL